MQVLKGSEYGWPILNTLVCLQLMDAEDFNRVVFLIPYRIVRV